MHQFHAYPAIVSRNLLIFLKEKRCLSDVMSRDFFCQNHANFQTIVMAGRWQQTAEAEGSIFASRPQFGLTLR